MSRSTFARHLPPCLVLCSLFVLSSPPAHAQREAATADARLRALYTEEWNWRRKELARSGDQPGDASDHFPRVDAASQQARLAYWTRTLAALDAIPFDQLSPEEKVNAQIFRTSIRALASDVQFRTYEAPFNSDTFFWTEFTPRQGFAHRRARIARIWRGCATCRATSTSRSPTCAPAWRAASPCRACRSLGRDTTIEPYVKGDASNPLYAPFTQMPADHRREPIRTALRAEAATRDSRHRRSRVRAAAGDDSRRVSAEGAHDARGQPRCRTGRRSTRRRSKSTRR